MSGLVMLSGVIMTMGEVIWDWSLENFSTTKSSQSLEAAKASCDCNCTWGKPSKRDKEITKGKPLAECHTCLRPTTTRPRKLSAYPKIIYIHRISTTETIYILSTRVICTYKINLFSIHCLLKCSCPWLRSPVSTQCPRNTTIVARPQRSFSRC